MKDTEFATLKSKVNAMLENKNSEIAELETKIAADEQAIQDAQKEMAAASDANDLSAYQQAKKKAADAKDGAEMRRARLEKLQTEPLITADEYASMKAQVFAYMDDVVERSKPELAAASEQLAAIGDDVAAKARRANELLRQIQGGLYLDSDRRKNSNGSYITSAAEIKSHYGVCGWARSGINNGMYADYTKERDGKKDE